MKLHLSNQAEIYIIQRYQEGKIDINDMAYTESLIVTPSQLFEDWRPERFDDFDVQDFERLAEIQPEVVILGTGTFQKFPSPQLLAPLIAATIGVEVMDTPAACRTYNILAAEQRNVAAALLIPMRS